MLGRLSDELRSEIVYRLASMDKTSPEFVDDVEAVLQEKLQAVFGTNLSRAGGEEVAAEILNSVSGTGGAVDRLQGLRRVALQEAQPGVRRGLWNPAAIGQKLM